MSNLYQLQMGYDQFQDRLILTMSTSDFNEYRFWLTRYCTKHLWELLHQLILSTPQEPDVLQRQQQQIAEQIEKEKDQNQSIAAKFSTKLSKRPLGDDPVLIAKISAKKEDNGNRWKLRLEGMKQESIEIGGDSAIASALCQLIRQTATKADWQLSFT